ncbi:MAG: D-glycero-beta-D-manno-heptose-7-phosphate kinase [Thermodesulfovibrio sp.]|nr:D-glycero-beta-D-manno-heptose-7-phosphate kinase [Thermodesulfovibrio sp.]
MDYRGIIKNFSGRKILVIGDLILDHYIWGKVNRISPEAPVPVVEVSRESSLLGGAANVARNIIALGGEAAVVGTVGHDRAGEMLAAMLESEGISTGGIFETKRPTTIKTRVIAHNQQVVRFDREDSTYLGGKVLKDISGYIASVLGNFDAVIISDYKKGMISGSLVALTVKLAMKRQLFVAVDPKVGHFNFYRGVSLITPNMSEASLGSGIEIRDDSTLHKAGRKLLRNLHLKAVLITRGEDGMSLFTNNSTVHIPTVAQKVYDVTGAGDTVISAFALAYAAGATLEEAAELSNHAAGIVVGEVGTAVATPAQIIRSYR